MRTLIQLLCGIVAFGATIWIIGATPTISNLVWAGVGGAFGYGLGWLALRAFPHKISLENSIGAHNSHS